MTLNDFQKINNNYFFTAITYFIIACYLLFCYPFMFRQFLPLPGLTAMTVITFATLIILLTTKKKLHSINQTITILIFIQMIVWIFFSFYHNDAFYLNRLFLLTITYFSLIALNNCNGGLIQFTKWFNRIIILMAIAGTICFFLVLIFSFQPLFEMPKSDIGDETVYFFGLTCTNSYHFNIIRYAGFFDEPGAMAYWGIFALLFNHLFIHNNRYENILITCLIFTFSLAYYIQLTLFLFLLKIKKKTHYIILALLAAIFVIAAKSLEDSEYSLIYDISVGRMEYDSSDGTLEGDNRSNLAAITQKHFLKAPWMGRGAKTMSVYGTDVTDNPYESLARDGIIGTIVLYAPLLITAFVFRNNRKYLYAIFILALGYLQRPFHTPFIHHLILYLFMALCFMYSVENKQIKTE